MGRRHETKGLARHHRETTAAGQKRSRLKVRCDPSRPRLIPARSSALLTWDEIEVAIGVAAAAKQSVEVGPCGPYYNNGRLKGEDFFASLHEYNGRCERSVYGATAREALSRLFSETASS